MIKSSGGGSLDYLNILKGKKNVIKIQKVDKFNVGFELVLKII